MTAGRKSATRTPGPTIQQGRITKAGNGRKPADPNRRPHRKVVFDYYSAASESEGEQRRRTFDKPGRFKLNLVKLKETVDRHGAWCPFVHLNKKLHHAHRRIRTLQGRPWDEFEIPDDNPRKYGPGNGNGSAHQVDNSDGEDEDEDELEDEDEAGAEQADVRDEPRPTVSQKKQHASKAKVTALKETALMKEVLTKPAHDEQPVPADDDVSESPNGEDPSSDNEDNASDTGNATAGAADKNAPTGKATGSKADASSKTSRDQGSDSESGGLEAPLQEGNRKRSGITAPPATPERANRKPLVKPIATTKGGAVKKRKASDTELTPDAEPSGKNRKSAD